MTRYQRAIPIALLALYLTGVAGGQAIDGDARSGALAGATTAMIDDRFTGSNVAAAGSAARPSVTLFASQSYGLAELRLGRMQYVQPLSRFAVVFEGTAFGYDMYRQSSLAIGAATEFRAQGPRSLYVGVAARYVHIAVPGYGSAAAIGLSVGGVVFVTPELHVGFEATNVNTPSTDVGQTLGHVLSVGFQYRPDDRARLMVEASKHVTYPVSIGAGVELQLADPLFVRAGFATKPTQVAGGFGVSMGSIAADVALQRHNPLGWSQAASLSIAW